MADFLFTAQAKVGKAETDEGLRTKDVQALESASCKCHPAVLALADLETWQGSDSRMNYLEGGEM